MKKIMGSLVGVALASAAAAQAQDKPTTYLMGTSYRCSQGDVPRADAIYKESIAPLLKASQTAGSIAAFGAPNTLRVASGAGWCSPPARTWRSSSMPATRWSRP